MMDLFKLSATLFILISVARSVWSLNDIDERSIDHRIGLHSRYQKVTGTDRYSPLVFIPGDAGSQLEAKLNKKQTVHYICDKKADWYDIWLNLHLLLPKVIDCTVDNMKLVYNSTTRTTHNTEGVQIRARDFGLIEPVAYLDVLKLPGTDYFENIVAYLEKYYGYTRNIDLVGASFDFRKAPNELANYFNNLTQLIQDTYIKNNFRPITLVCHSMGCLNSFYLLDNKPQSWRDTFVKRIVSIGAPWDGAFKAISAMLYGDNLGIFLLNSDILQELQMTFPSLMYLFPKEPTFTKKRVLVETPMKNYTLSNLEDLFKDSGLLDQLEMWQDTSKIAANLYPPNVELWCLYGSGVSTPSRLIMSHPQNRSQHTEEEGDGDGTVNLESLKACENFRKLQKKPVYLREFPSLDHIGILRDKTVADFISNTILAGDLA